MTSAAHDQQAALGGDPLTPDAPDHTAVTPPVLEIENLCISYQSAGGDVRAVENVSLSLRVGEVLGLAGESGSGKSTLAYGLCRLLRSPAQITGGAVIYRGRRIPGGSVDILDCTAAELRALRWREIAIVFQSAMNALNPMLRIQDQLTDVLEAHLTIDRAARVDRARSLLDLVGIPGDRLRSYPHELSGGMRQRIMIAMALAVEPEIIIMDEPTTALDVVVQQELLGEIAALQQQLGFSVLFITHDLSLLLEIADRLAIMYAGQLMEVASADDLYRQPAHPYTRGLLKSFPPLRGPRRELAGIPGSPPDLLNLPQGCPFHPRCEHSIPSCTEITIALRPLENEADVQHLSACPVIVESLAGLPQTPARPDGTPT